MDDARYTELLNAILDLRNATELGFADVYRRFDQMEERWDRRFRALDTRVEEGFRGVARSFDDIRQRLTRVEQR
ncbi:MAG: hypothetical protein WA431_09920 [Candidatus Cybelea sp.]